MKYKSISHEVDNIKFASRSESKYYSYLKIRLLAKEIENLQMQVPFLLLDKFSCDKYYVEDKKIHQLNKVYTNLKKDTIIRQITYIADFVFFNKLLQKKCIVDTKGFETTDYIIKRKLLLKSLEGNDDTIFIEVK